MKPKFLTKGDRIGIVAPAGHLKPKDIAPTLEIIKQHGYEPVLADHLFGLYDFGYKYAGTKIDRLQDLQKMLDDTSIQAIWCARGGYGTAQLIDDLDFSTFLKHPKWVIGYSDITVLHNNINNLGVATLHATTTKLLPSGQTDETLLSLFQVLKGDLQPLQIKTKIQNRLGQAKGELIGGNLSIIYSLLGSKTAMDTNGKILFMEDWREDYYHLDRMLINLKRNGVFDDIKGLLVGGMTCMDDVEGNANHTKKYDPIAYHIIKNHVEEYDFPVSFGWPAGHIKDNRALVFGQEIDFECADNFSRIVYI